MGRKHNWLRQYILLFPAACLIVLNMISGCQLPAKGPATPQQLDQSGNVPGTNPVQGLDSTATENLKQVEGRLLDQADAFMKRGEVEQALQTVARAISCCEGQYTGRAANILGAASSEMSARETEIQRLRNTVRAHTGTIQLLKEQISRLKAVDLELVQPETTGEVP
jgi:hypothetical protein